MGTFTGITAARANEILGESIVSGSLSEAGHLILTRANGSSIDAGDFSTVVADVMDDAITARLNVVLPNVVAGTVVDKGNMSGAVTFTEFTAGLLVNAMIKGTLTGDISINSMAMPAAPKPNTQFAMRLRQDATGNRKLTLTGFKKSMGLLQLTTTANATDIVVFLFDGAEWYAGLMGVDFK